MNPAEHPPYVQSSATNSSQVDERIAALSGELARSQQYARVVSLMRGVMFLLCCVTGLFTFQGHVWFAAGAVATCVLFVTFFALVWYYEWLEEHAAQIAMRMSYHQAMQARVHRDWTRIPISPIQPIATAATLANDLDLFGRNSLCDLISECHTPDGRALLSNWLCEPASVPEIIDRQLAVQWLVPQRCTREDLALHGRILALRHANPIDLVEWGRQPGWLAARRWITAATIFMSLTTIGLIIGIICLLIPPQAFLAVLGMLVAHVLFNAIWIGDVHDIFNRVSRSAQETRYYREMFSAVWSLPDDLAKFSRIRRQLGESSSEFHRALGSLRWLVALSSGRRAGALSLVYFFLQILFFWDFHVLIGLERWQRRYGPNLARWFDAVGQLEALCSFAGLAECNPSWTYPTFDLPPAGNVLIATKIGHPLLGPQQCVRNDVSLGPPGRFLFVTGSNMSGKSTLLRSIGVNAVLAQAGSVVCAQTMHLQPIVVATSVHVTDSLAEGTSFFMAELKRLKNIVDQARSHVTLQQPHLVFLLDEILQGTNSLERRTAVERILCHLIAAGATGAVTTHDLDLCRSPELLPHGTVIHFRESFTEVNGRQQMTFDYQVRPGICPTTNALKLLEIIGL